MSSFSPQGFMDGEGFHGTIKEGEWGNAIRSCWAFTSSAKAKGGRVTCDAKTIQSSLKECISFAVEQMKWQWDHVKRIGPSGKFWFSRNQLFVINILNTTFLTMVTYLTIWLL